jgi:hypothetical protein
MKNTFALIFFSIFLYTQPVLAQNLVINEILTSNIASNTDEDGTPQDWIELFNKGNVAINLSGFGLSDDAAILNKWVFPNVTIGAGQYLLIWASDKNRTTPGNPLHTNYKISSSGESITLSNSSGDVLDVVPATIIPTDISYGRSPNGTRNFVFFQTITPAAENTSQGYLGVLNPPQFSQNGGFYNSSFNLTLSSTDADSAIFYTLDGSEPSETNLNGTTYTYKNQYPELPGQNFGALLNNSYQSFRYTNPINISDRSAQPNKVSAISSTYDYDPSYYIPDNPVFKGTVIRVKVVKSGFISSKIVTKNYFITPQGSARFSLPVISISINEDRFYGYQNGIYVAGKVFDDWRIATPNGVARASKAGNYYWEENDERTGNMCYFVNGSEVINQDVGLKIRGGSTRRYEKKSLTVYARSEYGDGTMDYNFFPDLPYISYDRLTLSNSGWDFRHTKFRDAMAHRLCKSLHVESEAYQPTISFVNGEYFGILNIRERYDNNYFQRVYNTNSVDLLENSADIKEGDDTHYNAMTNYLESHSMASESNYNYIKTQLDPESFSDFFIANIFFQNADFPNNNVQYWRNKTSSYEPNAAYGLDGRWRWLLHDMDASFSFGTNDFNGNSLAIATSINTTDVNPDWSTLILRRLLENDSFKIDFINRFADLMNTSFLPSRIISTIDDLKNVIAPEMPEEISRWSVPVNLSEWEMYINREKDFAAARPTFQREHIRLKFGISSNINATLNVSNTNHGYIKMNTVSITEGTPGIVSNPYPWAGIYFNGIPLKLKAIAKPGFVFSFWSGASTSTNSEITITPNADFSVVAHFIPDTNYVASVPIYFWYMSGAIANNVPLETLNSTYQIGSGATIQFQSCLVGYPFPIGNVNRNKASMERRNSPTIINYRPTTNNNLPYDSSLMKGLQIKQMFQSGSLENLMIFNISTSGFKNIFLSFAVMNELAGVTGLSLDYATNAGTPVWQTSGLLTTSLPLSSAYQLFEIDFTTILSANDNANFKVRLRFIGPNLTLDTGNRVTFNNIAVDGVQLPLQITDESSSKYKIFPNPFSDVINITGIKEAATYSIYTMEGRLIKNQRLQNSQISLGELSKGVYFLQLLSNGKKEIHRIIKQ